MRYLRVGTAFPFNQVLSAMKFHPGDWIGLGLGCSLGLVAPFYFFDRFTTSNFNEITLLVVLVLGITIPPAMAAALKDMPSKQRTISRFGRWYVNSYLLFTAFGITTGVVGLSYYVFAGDIPVTSLLPIFCFGSAGFGYLLAYFVNPKLARRSER